MKPTEILKTQIEDGAFDFNANNIVDVGDGFAAVAGKYSVAICSDEIGGTILLPWSVINSINELRGQQRYEPQR